MPKLHVSLPNAPELVVDLTENTITIGRVDDNTIHIDDASVSSHHAELTESGGDYRLKDLDSTNGTRLNGERVTEEKLRDGDRLRFGQIEARYESEIKSESRPMPAADHAMPMAAATSTRPTDFANVSPFASKKKKKDPAGKAILAYAVLSILVFAAAVASVVMLKAPSF